MDRMVWQGNDEVWPDGDYWPLSKQLEWRATQATYRTWKAMRHRCYFKNAAGYKYYGGRGISVCERWRNSFDEFLKDMGRRIPGTTLDRIDPDGNYEPGNCRWATPKEQAKNRRPREKHLVGALR